MNTTRNQRTWKQLSRLGILSDPHINRLNAKLFPNNAIDSDGNTITEGMTVSSDGDTWVVGYASPIMIRLDRRSLSGNKECRIVGRKRFCCIHIIGWRSPQIF